MKRLKVSRRADSDLVALQSYGLENYGAEVAQSYYLGLLEAFEFLVETPFAGQVDEDTADGLRRWRYRQHKIFYDVSEEMILIVRVLHQQAHVSGQLG